jgi:predicted nucleotidyltransferase
MRFDNYFELLQTLQSLFGGPIDLVEPGGLINPYFTKSLNQTHSIVYVAS